MHICMYIRLVELVYRDKSRCSLEMQRKPLEIKTKTLLKFLNHLTYLTSQSLKNSQESLKNVTLNLSLK